MHDQLTEKNIEFCEFYSDPTALTECLIPENFNAPQIWSAECDTITLRPYQFAMQNYSYLYADDIELSKQENFNIKKGAGDSYQIGARDLGKSYLIKIDVLLSIIKGIVEGCVASCDAKHLKNITEPIASFLEAHKFLKIFHLRDSRKKTVVRSPLTVLTEHGSLIKSANEKIDSNNPGTQFHSMHYETFWYEEFSYHTDDGFKKRVDSGSSLGNIERVSGIPDLRIGSPMTKILNISRLKNWIWRLPQYCIAENSKILMADYSTKNIQDVNIGDKILSITEKQPFRIVEAEVENKVFTGIKDTVVLENKTNKLEITSDHKIFAKTNPWDKNWKSWDEFKSHYLTYSIPNYVEDYKKYYEGMFLGLLECEGSFTTRNNRPFYSIGQKSEKDTLEFLLNYLNIKHTKYFDNNDKDFAYFYLKSCEREYIKFLYDNLELSKDRLLGFIVGFVIGDGCVHFNAKTKHRDLVIAQKNKCKILEKVLSLLNIRYTKCKHGSNECFKYLISYLDLPIYAPFSKKAQIYQKMIKGQSLLPFRRTKIYKTENNKSRVWDLTTTSGTFIANGFIVHNCRSDWSEQTKQEKIEFYGGESSSAYKVNVEAEIIEGAYGFWDMKRLKQKCLREGQRVKYFEIHKDFFHDFENRLIVERLAGTEQVFICADIGGQASPTEIVIIFKVGDKYKYIYNISLFKLIQKEQAKVFKFLYDKLGTAFIAIDATCDNGVIIDYLFDAGIPQEHLLKVFFNKNIEVGFELDENGNAQRDKNGELVMKKARTIDWAMQELEKIIYDGKIEIPIQEKFLKEFNGFICKQTGMRKEYGSTTTDHLHQAMQVFSICRFFNEFNMNKNINSTKRCWGLIK